MKSTNATDMLSIEDIDNISSAFAKLTQAKKDEVFGRERIKKFSARTKAVYSYLVKKVPQCKYDFSIPAVLVPAMLGVESTHDQNPLFLEHGLYEHDWFSMAKKAYFKGEPEGPVEHAVPGIEDEKVFFRRDCAKDTMFSFVTSRFARVAMMRSDTAVGQELAELHKAVSDEVLKLGRDEVSVSVPAPVLKDAMERAVSERATERAAKRAAKRRRVDIENDDLEISINERRMELEFRNKKHAMELEFLGKERALELG
jgi:hypothetical protein